MDALPECIFVQTDLAFNYVLDALNELNEQGRLQVTHIQTAELINIQSNDPDVNMRNKFGGDTMNPAQAFARTSSSVVRMVMLRAANIPPAFWPAFGPRSQTRNQERILFNIVHPPPDPQPPQPFTLTANEDDANRYWSNYDHIYPHFVIRGKVSGAVGQQVSIPSMMLIFRNNFSELVEITTSFDATPQEDREFDSYIHVTCIHRRIISEGHPPDKIFTRRLKDLMQPVPIQQQYYDKIKHIKAGDDFSFVSDYFNALNLSDRE